MSSTQGFKTIVLVTSQGLRLWTLSRKVWTESKAKLSLEKAPSSEVVALTQGSQVLVLVSDAFTGHLQFVAPNKKESLTDEALGERLQADFQIDVAAYEFAMQRSNLSRTEVQVSVSGIESSVYQQILEWTQKLQARKLWLMPVGWFVAPLKSVEPVLLAVVGPKDQLFISHHYLGVDDARELSLAELEEYVQSRKEERKETHLLYVQGTPKVLKKLESMVGEMVAVHPLLPEASGDAFTEIITAVAAKGADTLGELLHFEEGASDEGAESAAVVGSIEGVGGDQASEAEGAQPTDMLAEEVSEVTEVDPLDAALLPEPSLPQPTAPGLAVSMRVTSRGASVEIEEESGEEAQPAVDSPAEVAEIIPEPIQNTADLHAALAEEEPEVDAPVIAEPAPEPEPVNAISRLAAEKTSQAPHPAAEAANARYREVTPRRSWGMIVGVFLGVVCLTVVIGGAIFWSQQVQPTQQGLIPLENPVPATPTPTPTPTPQPETMTIAEKGQLDMVVLNATTRAGLAGRYQSELEEAGWNVTSTGNAAGTYTDAGVYIFTTDETAFETLSRELGGVQVRRMTENRETAAKGDVIMVLNQPVEPSVTPVDSAPAATGSATR